MAKQKVSFWRHRSDVWNCLLAGGIGLFIGFNLLPSMVVGSIYIILMAICIIGALQNNLLKVFSVMPYICFSEIYIRANASWVPYLMVQYFFIVLFVVLLISSKQRRTNHSKAFVLLLIFTVLEVFDAARAEQPTVFRSIAIHSIALLLPAMWASLTALTPNLVSRLLYNFKIAAVYLAAIVVVAHLRGEVEYITVSNREASNGLAPVQLSGYLGFGCILLFFSIMDAASKYKWLNISCLGFVATIMILTFSRGGLYFLGITVAIYLFFNRQKLGSYFKFIVLLPVAYFIYSIVISETGGKIEQRYKEEGASNREVLVSLALQIFAEEPVIGVGTSNFPVEIKRRNLFFEASGAHNEFVRAAAEHGVFGIITYWGFFLFLMTEILTRHRVEKHFGVYFIILFSLISIHNGLKISVQPIVLMLAVGMPSLVKRKITNVITTAQFARTS